MQDIDNLFLPKELYVLLSKVKRSIGGPVLNKLHHKHNVVSIINWNKNKSYTSFKYNNKKEKKLKQSLIAKNVFVK